MKKSILKALGLIVLAGGILTACSEEKASTEKKEESTPAEQKEVSNKPKEDENGNVTLTEVGQSTKDDDGTKAELMKIKTVNQTVDISPVKLTVKDMKVIQLSNIGSDYNELLTQYTNGKKLPKKLNYIQIQYTAENTEEKNIGWNGIDKIVTNTGEQLDAANSDFIWEENGFDGTFYGKTKHEGIVGILTDSNPKDLQSLKFIISSSFDPDSYEDITIPQQTEFKF
ncbi:hypothetical protein COL23_13405 [Priestia aryabhattai]|uniref:hypothetical protein n=1 Tax=Priestia aryabhattai TaxID=412384 RepID=UPI000BF7B8F0|nr:hypothetical protein [Priestia aryabhattai]PFW75829.1 hypothetical protein COL23_13405 [Priestia aryabhattai]